MLQYMYKKREYMCNMIIVQIKKVQNRQLNKPLGAEWLSEGFPSVCSASWAGKQTKEGLETDSKTFITRNVGAICR